MHFHPKVTIVIPVHNGNDYLDQAIDSALAQTYRDIEVIVVDDGSTDRSTEVIAQRYGDTIKYVKCPNECLAHTLNFAISCMTGGVFTWLSHDDLHLPNKVSAQISYFNEICKRDAVLVSDVHLIDEDSRVFETQRWPYERFVKSPMLPLMLGCVNSCTIFIPIHILREMGPFDTSLQCTQDYELWNRILSRYEIFHQPEPLVAHRFSSDSRSRRSGAIVEVNALWISIIDARSEIERVQISGSSLRFYSEMADWLEAATNRYAADYARLRAKEVKERTLVSVILAATGEIEDVLAAALSVLEQTHDNLELLIVINMDNRDVFERLAIGDARVHLLYSTNSEPKRNHGLNEAKGDYVAFLNPEDRFLPDKIKLQVAAMQDTGSLFCHTSSRVSFPEVFDRLGLLSCGSFEGAVYPEILMRCPIVTSTVMIHRTLVTTGLRFDADATAGLDRLTWIWAAMRQPLLGLDLGLTVVTWAKRDAPVNMAKCWSSLRRARKLIESDFAHALHPVALAQLRTVEMDLHEAISNARTEMQFGSVLDGTVIEAAFSL